MKTLKITCMDGRSFISDAAFRTHIQDVHSADQLLFAKFEASDGDTTEVTIGVPYGAPLDVADAAIGVTREADTCDDCASNESAGRLPVHPGCGCEPDVGWEAYIKGLNQPADVSEELWKGFIAFLNDARKGKV